MASPFSAAARKPGSSLPCSWLGIWRRRVAKLPIHSGSKLFCSGSISGPTSSTCAPSASKCRAASAISARTSGSASTWPKSRLRPIRQPRTPSSRPTVWSRGSAGSERQSRGSGPAATLSASARVEHRARQHTLADHVGERRVGRVLGDAAVARLEADKAGMGRGDADRATAVIAVVERIDPGRRQRRGAARRTAGRMLQVPRIARGALQGRIGQGLPAELRRRRLANEDEPGSLEAVDDGCVLDGCRLVRGVRAVARRPALYRRRVLDGCRHAVERRKGLTLKPARLRGLVPPPGRRRRR